MNSFAAFSCLFSLPISLLLLLYSSSSSPSRSPLLPSPPLSSPLLSTPLLSFPFLPVPSQVNLSAIARDPHCEGFSGADLAALIREAALQALREAQRSECARQSQSSAPPLCSSTMASTVASNSGFGSLSVSGSGNNVGASAASWSNNQKGGVTTRTLQIVVTGEHFRVAFSRVFPSVSQASRARYDRMQQTLCRARSEMGAAFKPAEADEMTHSK